MSIERNLDEVVAACRDKATAVAADAAAVARREQALWRLVHEDGVPARQVPGIVRAHLTAEGFTADQIDGMGVSYGSIRAAVERPRH